ncbi:hypothetical protein R1flu_005706 [Riccia fluitans]|uniref:Uncharacterized protein n=1 Tax=Riccia fluitans TaxID=41844 RepID=A0ABD1YWY2_9MARC
MLLSVRLFPPALFYEFFKDFYSEAIIVENTKKYNALLYLAACASAEFLAKISLSPFKEVKVPVQSQPGFAKGIADGQKSLQRKE